MCLILLACRPDSDYPLVLAANRDEFYERPSAPVCFWDENPGLLAGRDLKEGGTWLGITKTGRIAAVTNFRALKSARDDALSRGLLVRDFLEGTESSEKYIERIKPYADKYNGFNIVLGTWKGLYCFSNVTGSFREISPGIHGLSNHLLDTPWPKVELGKELLGGVISKDTKPALDEVFEILADTSHPDEGLLPDTGVGLQWEKILSPIFISSPSYGTRSSSVIIIDREGHATFAERIFDSKPETNKFEFKIG